MVGCSMLSQSLLEYFFLIYAGSAYKPTETVFLPLNACYDSFILMKIKPVEVKFPSR